MKLVNKPSNLFATGLIISILMAAAGYLFMNPGQCPEGYTQVQIDSTGCIVGANIGLSIVYSLAAVIFVVSILGAMASYFTNRRDQREQEERDQ